MNTYKYQNELNKKVDGGSYDVWYNTFCPYRVYWSSYTDSFIAPINHELSNNPDLVDYIHTHMTSTTTDGHPCLTDAITFEIKDLPDSLLYNTDLYIQQYNGGLSPTATYKIWDGTTHTMENLNNTHIGKIYFVGKFYGMPRFSTVYSTDLNMQFLPAHGMDFTNPNPSLIPPSVDQIYEINDAIIPGYEDDGQPVTYTEPKYLKQYQRGVIKYGMIDDLDDTITYTLTKHVGNGINVGVSSYYVNFGPYPLNPVYNEIGLYGLSTVSNIIILSGTPSNYHYSPYRVPQPVAPPNSDYVFPIPNKLILNGDYGSYQPDDPTIPRLCYRGFLVLGV